MIIVSKVKIKRLKYRGFSLVELSVSLAIISMIVGSALSVAVTNDYATKKLETERKLDRIEEALAGFLAFNLRLPCPANGTTLISATTFGQEGTLTPAAGGVSVCPNQNFTAGAIRAGVVPVDTLQLPDDFMFDGWGRRITYVVDYKFVNNKITNTTCTNGSSICFVGSADSTANVEVRDVVNSARTTIGIYALISHGENGHGAFTKNGSATRLNGFTTGSPYKDATASAHELENAEFDNAGANTAYDDIFVMRDYTKVDDLSAAASARVYFDDIVRYKEKNLLVKEAGEVMLDDVCNTAETVVNNPSSNSCTGVVGEEDCEAFAIEIYQRCLK
jgi:prepilin-type N-terminal cleavage/methylation domain-containing protein